MKLVFQSRLFRAGLMAGAIMLALGCQSKNNDTPPATAQRTPTSRATPAPSPSGGALALRVQPLPPANSYQVMLDWNGVPPESDFWLIQREDETNGLRPLATLDRTKTELVDNQVTAGETYRYYLATNEGASSTVKAKAEIHIPVDMEIIGERSFAEIKGVQRLFLTAGSHLLAQEKGLRISADEILAQGGVIETFRENQRAPAGRDGRRTGPIIVQAKRGVGKLTIYSRGENGGTGLPGNPGAAGVKGNSGNPARLRDRFEGVDPLNRVGVNVRLKDMASNLPADHPKWAEFFECVQPPTNGGQGTTGQMGGPGFTGGKGGDTAPVFVQISNPSAIDVRVTRLIGLGGLGGPGGKGGPGGPGGDPGALDEHKVCHAASGGPPGSAGPDGAAGTPGTSGLELPYCLKMGNAVFGQCDQFPASTTQATIQD